MQRALDLHIVQRILFAGTNHLVGGALPIRMLPVKRNHLPSGRASFPVDKFAPHLPIPTILGILPESSNSAGVVYVEQLAWQRKWRGPLEVLQGHLSPRFRRCRGGPFEPQPAGLADYGRPTKI